MIRYIWIIVSQVGHEKTWTGRYHMEQACRPCEFKKKVRLRVVPKPKSLSNKYLWFAALLTTALMFSTYTVEEHSWLTKRLKNGRWDTGECFICSCHTLLPVLQPNCEMLKTWMEWASMHLRPVGRIRSAHQECLGWSQPIWSDNEQCRDVQALFNIRNRIEHRILLQEK